MTHRLKRYFTGYLAFDWYEYPSAPYQGKGWEVTFEETEKCEGKHTNYKDGTLYKDREMVIYARSLESALKALDLINSAFLLHTGQAPLTEFGRLLPEDKIERMELSEDDIMDLDFRSTCTSGFPAASILAAKASHKKELQYALAKFRLATLIYSRNTVELDPFHAPYESLGMTRFISQHIAYAYSIIASYSVIEEIGLEVRASHKKPSLINGKWNFIVREHLEKRLKEANVDVNKGIYWIIRGNPTKLQKYKRVSTINKLPTNNRFVRDRLIDICDAINYASYLRSTVSSHKTNDLIKSLTPIDSENVRHLAGYLLLSKLGLGIK